MVKSLEYADKDVDLKALAQDIKDFFINDDFPDVKLDMDPNGAWYEVQATKKGVGRTLVASRKALHVIIKGSPNQFNITMTVGEWGKNVASALLIPIVGWAGLVGLGINVRFNKKIWNFIKNSVEKHSQNTVKKNQEVKEKINSSDDPIQVLKFKFVNGEITKEEFEEKLKFLKKF